MQLVTRIAPWCLCLFVVVAVGCNQPNERIAALEQENTALKAQVEQMNTKLAAAQQQAQRKAAQRARRDDFRGVDSDQLSRQIMTMAIKRTIETGSYNNDRTNTTSNWPSCAGQQPPGFARKANANQMPAKSKVKNPTCSKQKKTQRTQQHSVK